MKQEAHGSRLSPEQQFLVTFYYVADAISILYFEPFLGPRY